MTTSRAEKAIRDIATVVDLDAGRPTAALAADLAHQVDAHLTGLALVYDPLIPVYTVATPLPAEFIADAREQAIGDAKRSAAAFEAAAAAAGISSESRLVESVGTSGFGDIVRQCALADMVVIGQQNPDRSEPMREALIEAVLFQAGVPTLIVPHAGPSSLGTAKAIVAWDGRATAARAAREALPLLALTDSVIVAIVTEGKVAPGDAPGAEIATYLARHGLNVTVRPVPNVHKDVAGTLLSFAAEEGADFLVMGAYGHGRLREFILGGVTRGILDGMTLPVIMSH